MSRSREYLADETGSRISKDPRSLTESLKKLHSFSRAYPLASEPKYEATSHLFIISLFKPSFFNVSFFNSSADKRASEEIRSIENLISPSDLPAAMLTAQAGKIAGFPRCC